MHLTLHHHRPLFVCLLLAVVALFLFSQRLSMGNHLRRLSSVFSSKTSDTLVKPTSENNALSKFLVDAKATYLSTLKETPEKAKEYLVVMGNEAGGTLLNIVRIVGLISCRFGQCREFNSLRMDICTDTTFYTVHSNKKGRPCPPTREHVRPRVSRDTNSQRGPSPSRGHLFPVIFSIH